VKIAENQRPILIAASLLFVLAGCSNIDRLPALSSSASTSAISTSEQKAEILALFDQWNKSLATGNASAVATNYAPNAILLPTVSNKIRRTQAERIDYFEHFLLKKPHGKIDQANVRIFGDIAINSGLYTFTYSDGSKVHARYTFVYQKQPDGRWLIIEHHSSKLPE
jgi:uncharacterized protein (TIGR02246 family)